MPTGNFRMLISGIPWVLIGTSKQKPAIVTNMVETFLCFFNSFPGNFCMLINNVINQTVKPNALIELTIPKKCANSAPNNANGVVNRIMT
jgi:hypothetical protein